MLSRFNPAVPRNVLFAVAGFLWTIAGGLLCVRAALWLEEVRFAAALEIETGAVVLAIVAYALLFSRLVRRNIDRIVRLPDRACVFAFTAWRGYVMIALMVTAGILLRNSTIPHYYLSLPYTAMGGVLLTGSIQFYRKFVTSLVQTKV